MNVVSLFAGCGGLDLGFEQAGFNVVWANEFDKVIHDTYRLNHPYTELCGDDIRTVKSEDIPDCDGIIGGPPCQSWSVGGRGLGIEDERGKLFFDYIRVVKDKKPKFFLIENVAGILRNEHLPAFNMFLNMLSEPGYDIQYALLNAADFSVPQDRFRVFIVGIRKDLHLKFVFPTVTNGSAVTLRDAIGDIEDAPRFSEGRIDNVTTESGLWNHDVYSGPYSSNYMHSNRVRSWDEVSYTIQAQASNAPQHPQAPKMGFGENGFRTFKRGSEHLYRRLSVRECARIQTFPDSFRFVYSDIKDGYKMVGNAVPPKLAETLACQMATLFGMEKKNRTKTVRKANQLSIRHDAVENPKNCLASLPAIETLDFSRDLLICFVKKEDAQSFEKRTSRLYYSGKRFPTTIELNKACYFMPYIKDKGIRDLYLIKSVRTGTKHEVHHSCKDYDMRLVFEVEFVQQVFADYVLVRLNIWHTYTNTTMECLSVLMDDMETDVGEECVSCENSVKFCKMR